jgi:non-heme chloroperoxidase
MPTITTKDGVEIFYKDWGSGQPIVFSHGWPLSADDWDAQLLFFLHHGYRVIAHDRRGHGRSTQTADGHDMDHYADDLAALTKHLDLKDAIHVGHSTGGGEVTRYLARRGQSGVVKAALISAVPPLMVKTAANPLGLPKAAFDDLQAQLAANRSQFYRDVPAGPFYGYNRPGAKASEAVIAQKAVGAGLEDISCSLEIGEWTMTELTLMLHNLKQHRYLSSYRCTRERP